MKFLKNIVFFSFALTLFCSGFLIAENIKEAKLKTNAHCGNCKTKIEGGLNKIDGVKSTSVELKDKIATIKYDADKLNEEKLKTSVIDMGYKAEVIKVAAPIQKAPIKDGKKSTLNIIK